MVLRPIRGDYFIVLTIWESEEHFRAWTESAAFEQAHRQIRPQGMFSGRSELEIHEVVIDTRAG